MAFGFSKSLVEKFTGRPVDWEELEEALIRSDIGVPMMTRILKACQAHEGKLTAESVVTLAREEILKVLPRDNPVLRPLPSKTKVILVVGVNGTGKTTSTAKLAAFLKRKGHSVMLAAADTFRAAAIEQLGIWAERIGCEIVQGQYNGDPAAPHETFLVVDATTGGNALSQAREFHAASPLTGVIVTKLDGSGKGGCVIAIQNEVGVPTRFIGTGEKLEDLDFFESRRFVEQML